MTIINAQIQRYNEMRAVEQEVKRLHLTLRALGPYLDDVEECIDSACTDVSHWASHETDESEEESIEGRREAIKQSRIFLETMRGFVASVDPE